MNCLEDVGDIFEEVHFIDEDDIEERIERAWLAVVMEPGSRRRRFGRADLAGYPFTQPADICQRCERWTGDEDMGWELDHIVELQFGGLDHPSNLVRLCWVCHRDKPLPTERTWGDPEAMRELVVAWIRRGPLGGRRVPLRDALPWLSEE